MLAKVSVIIPAYNAGKYIGEALDSIMLQTRQADEIIVIDDGSKDDTKDIVKHFTNVNYVYQQNKGTAYALNAGIENSKGTYLAFLDADDLWMPGKLAI